MVPQDTKQRRLRRIHRPQVSRRQLTHARQRATKCEGKAAEETPLQKVMKGYLEEYNLSTTKPMDLVMFQFAIVHCARIARMNSS